LLVPVPVLVLVPVPAALQKVAARHCLNQCSERAICAIVSDTNGAEGRRGGRAGRCSVSRVHEEMNRNRLFLPLCPAEPELILRDRKAQQLITVLFTEKDTPECHICRMMSET
jgi:hypothetical protein